MKKYLFLDIETSGLPMNQGEALPHYTDLKAYDKCRLLQVGGILTFEDGTEIFTFSNFIDNEIKFFNNYPKNGIKAHHIKKYGFQAEQCLLELVALFYDSSIEKIIIHNKLFEVSVIVSEVYRRANLEDKIVEHQFFDKLYGKSFCTQEAFTKHFQENQIPMQYGKVALKEIYWELFQDTILDAHTALGDAKATKKIYFEGKKRGIL